MSAVRMIGIRNNSTDYKLSLPLARHIKKSDPRGKSEVSKEVTSEFIQRTVSTRSKTNHTKYCGGTIKQTLPNGNITIQHTSGDYDPDVIEKLLHGHPCPVGQGPFIDYVDHDFGLFTVFRHSSDQACVDWAPVEKDGWLIKYNVKAIEKKDYSLEGPISNLDMRVVYTCQLNKCFIHCCCNLCMDQRINCRMSCKMDVCQDCSSQCSDHKIKYERLFNVNTDQFTLVTSQFDAYRYAVPYAGIPLQCDKCQQDLIDHQTFHVVYHMRCKFCRHATRPYHSNVGVLPVNYMHREKEIRRREDMSCEFCFEKLSDKHVRIRHENTEHRECKAKNLKCPDCEKSYSNTNALNHHAATKHQLNISGQKFVCELCDEQFLSKLILSNHRKTLHDGPVIESHDVQGFNCNKCDKIFTNKRNMLRHKKEVHLISSKYLLFADPESVGFKCETCHQKFERKDHLKRHVSTVHKESKDQRFTCENCSKSFGRIDSLKRHNKSHDVIKEDMN